MKSSRQNKIIELITQNEICTQEDLLDRLLKAGFGATQATVSRDIRQLGITKVLTEKGYKYVLSSVTPIGEITKSPIISYIQKVSHAGNMVVVKTAPGLASAVATTIDAMKLEEILGCVAGDDTIIIVATDESGAEIAVESIKNITKTI